MRKGTMPLLLGPGGAEESPSKRVMKYALPSSDEVATPKERERGGKERGREKADDNRW